MADLGLLFVDGGIDLDVSFLLCFHFHFLVAKTTEIRTEARFMVGSQPQLPKRFDFDHQLPTDLHNLHRSSNCTQGLVNSLDEIQMFRLFIQLIEVASLKAIDGHRIIHP